MSAAPRVLAIVPARGGSQGLPGKNLRPMCGVPLIVHSIRVRELLPSVTRLLVSTDDEAIRQVALAHDAEVPFIRPAELASSQAPMPPVLRHALAFVEEDEGRPYDVVLLLDPTSPARVPEEIEAALAMLLSSPEYDGVVSVSQPAFNPLWVGVRPDATDPRRMTRYFEEGRGVTRRQDVPRFLRVNGNFYLWRAEYVRRMPDAWMDEGVHGMVEIPELRAHAIDSLEDFELLETLVQTRRVELPGLRLDP